MPYIKQHIISIFLFLIFLIVGPVESIAINTDDDPSIIIHDTVTSPGELLLRVDATNFVGDNGQISAITLNIDVDTSLIEFISIQNMSISGNWLGNYNVYQNEITITYTAPFGTGYDIDGSLLDIKLEYFGGFDADLILKPNCEVTNVNLQTIQNISYTNGLISQSDPLGYVSIDSVTGSYNELFSIPVFAEGMGYNNVVGLSLRIGHDTNQLNLDGIVDGLLSNIVLSDFGTYITIDWVDATSGIDLSSQSTLFYLNYYFIGDTNTDLQFLPGSKVINNDTIVATDFINGFVEPLFPVVLINNPDTSGTSLGEGYYHLGDSVSITAIPFDGFHFLNWTEDTIVISNDSLYAFVKQNLVDTIYANYSANNYNLSLVPLPPDGGNVLGQGNYLYGESVTVTAVPAQGYDFGYWIFGSDTLSEDPIFSFIMPADNIELIALFLPEEYLISAIPNNTNYGMVDGSGNYFFGETVSLTATPFVDYEFIVWTEGIEIISYNSLLSFVADSDRELVANFQYISDCSPPIGLFAGSNNETSVILYWVSSGDEQEWDLLWGETGFDTITGGNLVEGIFDTEYILEDLIPGEEYDFYVRAVCNDSTYSLWSDPHTFSTWFVGIKNIVNEVFTVYPNPASNSLFIKSRKAESAKYYVINIMGEQIDSGEIDGIDIHVVNVEAYHSGLYFIRLYSSSFVETITFLKK